MSSRRLRVLACDGGGVRGLSTLLILRALLCKINESDIPMRPQEAFDLFTGTSTGGLIAIMIVKFDMDVDECIEAYKKLAKEVFGRKSLRGRLSGGFAKPKYSDERFDRVIASLYDRHGDLDLQYKMEDLRRNPKLVCTVVCTELETNWTKRRKRNKVLLCSHCCRYETCRVCDAARATSAAPTYFKEKKVGKRILVDGGYGETNNPSLNAYRHYLFNPRNAPELTSSDDIHWVNIGTGTWPKNAPPPTQPWLRYLLPGAANTMLNSVRDLMAIATECETTADYMRTYERLQSRFSFSRFSADTGLHTIALDRHDELEKIEQRTAAYLQKRSVKRELERVAACLREGIQLRRQEETAARMLRVEHEYLEPRRSTSAVSREERDRSSSARHISPGPVPSASGTSESTVRTSEPNQTPRPTTPVAQEPVAVVVQEFDMDGVGGHFDQESTQQFLTPSSAHPPTSSYRPPLPAENSESDPLRGLLST
jgi:hypothetical protein